MSADDKDASKIKDEKEEAMRLELEKQEALEREISARARRRWQLVRERLILDKKGSYVLVTVSLEKSGSGKQGDLSDDYGLLGKVKKMGGDGPGLIVVEDLDRALMGAYNEKLPDVNGKPSSKKIRTYSILTDVNGRTTAEAMLSELLVSSKASLKFQVPVPKSVTDAYFVTRAQRREQKQGKTQTQAAAFASKLNDENIDEHLTRALTRKATALSSKRRSSLSLHSQSTVPSGADAAGATEAAPAEEEQVDEEVDDEEEQAKVELASLMLDPSNALLIHEYLAANATSSAGKSMSSMGSLLGDFSAKVDQQHKDATSDGGFFSQFFCCGSKSGKQGPPLQDVKRPSAAP